MKWFGIIAMTLLMTMTGCKKEMGTQYRGCFENDDAVSLKDIIDIYDKYASAKEDSTDFDLFAAFYGQDAADNVLEYEIVSDSIRPAIAGICRKQTTVSFQCRGVLQLLPVGFQRVEQSRVVAERM